MKPYLNAKGELPAFLMDNTTEQAIESAVQHTEANSVCVLPPQAVREIVSRLERRVERREVPTVVLPA